MNKAPILSTLVLASLFAFQWIPSLPAQSADSAKVSTTLNAGGNHLIVEAHGLPPKAPVFFSVDAKGRAKLVDAAQPTLEEEFDVTVKILQGAADTLSLGLIGEGDLAEVSGDRVASWAVRVAPKSRERFLDIRLTPKPELAPNAAPGRPGPTDASEVIAIKVRMASRKLALPADVQFLTLGPGAAAGFNLAMSVDTAPGLALRTNQAEGFSPLKARNQFVTGTNNQLVGRVVRSGVVGEPVELTNVSLEGTVNEATGAIAFVFNAQASVREAGAVLDLLNGAAAISALPKDASYRLRLDPTGKSLYQLEFPKAGTFALQITFEAKIHAEDDLRSLNFRVPTGGVVPLTLKGFRNPVAFQSDRLVVPQIDPDGLWRGFLPATGDCGVAWKIARTADDGRLFFESTEQSDIAVSAGLLRQDSVIGFRILQGQLDTLTLALNGPGEILSVSGTNVVGWKVADSDKDKRTLAIQLSRPMKTEGSLKIASRVALGAFPIRTAPLRLTPQGAIRHSGWLRIRDQGAVRLETGDLEGLTQLAPEQWPANKAPEGTRQSFVYRFPSDKYAINIAADQILPRTLLSEVVVYDLGETDRTIAADIELEIREAPLREFEFLIPEGYSVAALAAADLKQYSLSDSNIAGKRTAKVIFTKAILGRELLQLRLMRNEAAKAGTWELPTLSFPSAESVRGFVGISAAAGFRITPGNPIVPSGNQQQSPQKLAELPLNLFPSRAPRLQQAFRIREADWTATMRVESLGQSVQADVFHLYSLKQGMIYGSILVNYFVVGSPVNEWRLTIPEAAGNVAVDAMNMRNWRREGNEIIVTLNQSALGASTLLLAFEEPMSSQGGAFTPGTVHPKGVEAERGYIHVVSPAQVRFSVPKASDNLLRLDPSELPNEFRVLSASPSLAVYQYSSLPFTLEMSANWFEPADTVEQVIDFARLNSQIARDGQMITNAVYFVKSRGLKTLRLKLPKDARLWEAKAGNELVTPRKDGELTLIPLPARNDPNEPVQVALRYGEKAPDARRPVLQAPDALSPGMTVEWHATADSGRILVPIAGNLQSPRSPVSETGFEWLRYRANRFLLAAFSVFLAAALALARRTAQNRKRSTVYRFLAGVSWLAAILLCVGLVTQAVAERRQNSSSTELITAVAAPAQQLTATVRNIPMWEAMLSGSGILLLLGGLIVLFRQRRATGHSLRTSMGWALIGAGLLAQSGGAILFFAALLAILLYCMVRQIRSSSTAPGTPGIATTAALLMAALFITASSARAEQTAEAQASDASQKPQVVTKEPALESLEQKWRIEKNRLFATATVTVQGQTTDSFLLLRGPAVLTSFKGDGVRLSTRKAAQEAQGDDETELIIVPERAGRVTATISYEMPMGPAGENPGNIPIPTGPAAIHTLTIDMDQAGWGFASPQLIRTEPVPGVAAGHSAARLLLAPNGYAGFAGDDGEEGLAQINLEPKRRDLESEATQFYAETRTLMVPSPGVVDGYHEVRIRPSQGKLAQVEISIPQGYTVGNVADRPDWRFDPESRRLRIQIDPAQSEPFNLLLESQRSVGGLPYETTLEPLKVQGAAGQVGMLAVGFGPDAQIRGLKPEHLQAVNLEDFERGHLASTRPEINVQQVFRHGQDGGSIRVQAGPVAPEIRAETSQMLSLGEERLSLSAEMRVAITRAGIFQLSFPLPQGLELETLTGPALSHWSEVNENGARIIRMHLNGRTMGVQTFNLNFTAPYPGKQKRWEVPRLTVREADRQTGDLLVIPARGIQVRALERDKVSQSEVPTAAKNRPGAAAFRLLQSEWKLALQIEELEPWVTAQMLHEMLLREGQTRHRVVLRYKVDNAAVKTLRLRLPGLDADAARTVRANGRSVSDAVAVSGDLWEIRFQRSVIGETDLEIEYQCRSNWQDAPEKLAIAQPENVRQLQAFVAVRGVGRLELTPEAVPKGWLRTDWQSVPAELQTGADRSVPALTFRANEPQNPLALIVRRNDIADTLKLTVTRGTLTSVVSASGAVLTGAELGINVTEKGTMRVELPKGATFFGITINGESAAVVKDGDSVLFQVAAGPNDEPALVRFFYSEPARNQKNLSLVGPRFHLPLENVRWDVIVPDGYTLQKHSGNLDLGGLANQTYFRIEDYLAVSSASRAAEGQKATTLIAQANAWLKSGDPDKARKALTQASRNSALDAASNEDARVQLRELQTREAVLGLNMRRQKVLQSNKLNDGTGEANQKTTLPDPAGAVGNPQQYQAALQANSDEENQALRRMASRIVSQQLAAEPAPQAILPALPMRGELWTFTRRVQVDGSKPLTLDLAIVESRKVGGLEILAALAAITLLATLLRPATRP